MGLDLSSPIPRLCMTKFEIKSIISLKRRKGWHEIIISGQAPFQIDDETIFKFSLKEGLSLTESEFKKIKSASDLAFLKDKGMRILTRRMISERDLRRKLAAERKSPAIRDEAVSSLKRYGFIDDAKFAGAYIRSQMAQGPKSRLYLKKKLYQRGISAEIAEKAIAEELEGYDFKASVRELALKKYKSLQDLPPQKARSRLVNYLMGKGFGWDIIKYAIAELMVEEIRNEPGEID